MTGRQSPGKLAGGIGLPHFPLGSLAIVPPRRQTNTHVQHAMQLPPAHAAMPSTVRLTCALRDWGTLCRAKEVSNGIQFGGVDIRQRGTRGFRGSIELIGVWGFLTSVAPPRLLLRAPETLPDPLHMLFVVVDDEAGLEGADSSNCLCYSNSP